MNVTFLSSTSTFNGLLYNYKKVEQGTAELLHTQNMNGLLHLEHPTKEDYLSYLKAWSERNSRVKNPQFHVAISVRGREKTAEELLGVSREWMEKMGYKDTPALFFFHRDTDNNHIHIVSSRVGSDRNKINDSNEIRRGVAHLRAMDRVALAKQAEKDRLDALGYLVSTRAQLASVLSRMGYRIKVEDDGLAMYKGKERLQSIDKALLDTHLQKTVALNAFRSEQIRNAIAGYSQAGLSVESMKSLLKEKLNIDLVFYGKKDAPYGWSVIDHEWKSVYKGNEVLPLKELLNESQKVLSDSDRLRAVTEQVNLALSSNPRMTSSELKAIAKAYGVYQKKGELMYNKIPIGKIPDDMQERLSYNDRLDKARRITPSRQGEVEAMARFFKIDQEDLLYAVAGTRTVGESGKSSQEMEDLYREYRRSEDPRGVLQENHLVLLRSGNEIYLMDLDKARIEVVDSRPVSSRTNSYDGEENSYLADSIEDLIEDLNPSSMYDNDRGSSVDNRLRNKKKRR